MRVRVFVGLVSAVLTPFILTGCHGSDSIAPIPFWSSVPSGTTQDLWSVWGTSASDVWAVGWNGTILHYNGTIEFPSQLRSTGPSHSAGGA
jgi:hypothetical protein